MHIKLSNPGTVKYQRIPIGTKLICKEDVIFLDGSGHFAGCEYVVTEDTQSYYSVMKDLYEVKRSCILCDQDIEHSNCDFG